MLAKKTVLSLVQDNGEEIRAHGVKRMGIFGSFAKNTQKNKSDIDVLVEFSRPVGFEFAGIEFELEKKLKKKVDLLTYKSVHPLLKKRILNEEIRII